MITSEGSFVIYTKTIAFSINLNVCSVVMAREFSSYMLIDDE